MPNPKTTTPAGPDGAGDELVPAIGTTPGKQPTETGESTTPTEPTDTKPTKTMWPVEGETAAAYAMDRLAYNETTRTGGCTTVWTWRHRRDRSQGRR